MKVKQTQIIDYIKEANYITSKRHKEHFLYKKIFLFIKDQLPDNIDISNVIDSVEGIVPEHLVSEVDAVYVGQFKEFEERSINSLFMDGAIYVTNEQDNDEDMIDDIVHEISHSLERRRGDIIYSDRKVEQEFLGKRNRLYHLLKAENIPVDMTQFLNSDYSSEFDDYLYNKIGYEKLANILIGLFISPYAVTSIREYFATGFTEVLMGDYQYLSTISPKLFEKLQILIGENYES